MGQVPHGRGRRPTAGHVQDRWYKTVPGPDGAEKSGSFPDKQKRRAEAWLSGIEADMSQGRYIDPAAGPRPSVPRGPVHGVPPALAPARVDAGESIKALGEHLGHRGPSFTLRTYTHLKPNSETRTRAAVDRVLQGPDNADDGPGTAPEMG
ncbi:hypothetical protein SUDANB176_01867 [Streptomyces sp. enrichment culture]|uniref:hypothetical protein n=1 Tax=Streptomyces sp. enrichment culture TaxID=1795815 RepID=UPI003F54740F